MKVIVNSRFRDVKAGTIREAGDQFVVSKARFDEIEEKLPGYLSEVKESESENEKAPEPEKDKAPGPEKENATEFEKENTVEPEKESKQNAKKGGK